jgi:transposase
MSQKRAPYKTYTKEFKQEAVQLMETSDRPASEIAMQLGIRRNQLYKWKEQLEGKGPAAFAGPGRPPKSEQSEVASLKQELNRLREENEILKKAAAFFARELK